MMQKLQESIDPNIEISWKSRLKKEFEAEYFLELKKFLITELTSGKKVFPPGNQIFNAFNWTPFDKVKVVIIGQDPYHGAGQANGICFSVADNVSIPPSLKNVFKELSDDLGYPVPQTGNLEKWARQGVLLLNASLTVRENEAGSHQNRGWEQFTNAVIRLLSEEKSGLVFLLWGKFAQQKADIIDTGKHFLLKAAHPSPFSAYNGFIGCKHFSKTNEILMNSGKTPIDWQL
jgi:uracil-DNA glycosylase